MSGFVNKVKEALHSDKPSQPEGTHGTHSSGTADPRIDSDRDHRAARTGGGLHEPAYNTAGTHEASHIGTGTHEGAFAGGNNRGHGGPAPNTDGPHKSDMLNKADPRIDSDRDYSRNMGANPERSADIGHNTGSSTTGTHHSALGSSTGTHGATTGYNTRSTGATAYDAPESTYGQHNNRLANAADPRIDSDRDHRGAVGHTGTTTGLSNSTGHHAGGISAPTTTSHNTRTTGTTGYDAPEGTYGQHNSRLANTADPRIDSDRDHRSAPGHSSNTTSHHTGTTTGLGSSAGPAPHTAGPHKSDMLNKVDPRVDSNLDGSKTYGGDKTYAH